MKWALRRILPLLLATVSLTLPSGAPNHENNEPYQAAFRIDGTPDENFLEWERPPNPNDTHHLIFNSVSGLLQRWPNTFRRNGELVRLSFLSKNAARCVLTSVFA